MNSSVPGKDSGKEEECEEAFEQISLLDMIHASLARAISFINFFMTGGPDKIVRIQRSR